MLLQARRARHTPAGSLGVPSGSAPRDRKRFLTAGLPWPRPPAQNTTSRSSSRPKSRRPADTGRDHDGCRMWRVAERRLQGREGVPAARRGSEQGRHTRKEGEGARTPGGGLVQDPEPPGRGGRASEKPGHRARGPEHTVLMVLHAYCQTVPHVIILQAQQIHLLILPVPDPPPPEQCQGSGSYTRQVPGRPPVPAEAEARLAGARPAVFSGEGQQSAIPVIGPTGTGGPHLGQLGRRTHA